MTFCPKCGNELRPGLHFCPKCGSEKNIAKCTPETHRTGPVEPVSDNATSGEASNIPPVPHNPTNNAAADELLTA